MNKVRRLSKKIERLTKRVEKINEKYEFKIDNAYIELEYWLRQEGYDPYEDFPEE